MMMIEKSDNSNRTETGCVNEAIVSCVNDVFSLSCLMPARVIKGNTQDTLRFVWL